MEQAAILKSGEVVKLTGLINPKYTIYGFLNSFEAVINGVTKKFKETVKEDFKDVDLVGQVDQDVIGGFYEEDFFLEYLIDKNKLYELKNHKYTFKAASANDEIIVKKLKVSSPYTDFCKIETYKWAYQPNVPIVDYGTWQIKIPNGVNPDPLDGVNVELTNNAMQFYSHKIGLFVTPLTDQNDKQAKAFLFAKIAILINSIQKNLFSKFLTEPEFQTYLSHQTFEWTNNPIFVNPTVEILEDYFGNLNSYYKSFYANQILVKNSSKKNKFYWLATILSAEGLATVPYIDRIELLYNLSKPNVKLTERNRGEALALRIVESFTFESVSSVDRNDLLKDLVNFYNYITLQGGNGAHQVESKTTLFEILYKDIDDDRYSRYTFGFWTSYNNRMKYIILLYRIWFNSTYNPIYPDPSYTKQLNACGVYEESPYMKLVVNPDPNNSIKVPKYYNDITAPPFIIYESAIGNRSGAKIQTTTNYNYKMVGKSIEVYEYKIESRKGYDDHYSDPILYGTYDFLQPITVLGLKPDLDLVESLADFKDGLSLGDQKIHTIPAFLLFYMEDYSNLKKIDFGVMLAAEIALNLTGVGALADIRYLGYLSKMRSIWTAESVVASDVVLSWKAISGVVNAVEFTSINVMALNNYTIHTTNDSATKKAAEKTNEFLFWVTISSMVTKPYVQSKVIDSAFELNSVVKQFNDDGISIYTPEMTPSQIYEFDQALVIVSDIAGNKELVVNTMIQKLEAYGIDSSEILRKYRQIDNSAEKYAFYVDLGFFKDPAIRKLFNANEGKAIDNWRLCYANKITAERKSLSFLTNEKYAKDLVKLYEDTNIRKTLEPIEITKKQKFLDTYGDISDVDFAKMKANTNFVNEWQKYYDDLIIRSNFNSLNQTRQIELLERYGHSEAMYLRIKNNPDIILSFDKYAQRPELIANIKLYSADIKNEIIFFERFSSKNEEWFNIFKNDPLEIAHEINICEERLVKTFNNFKYEKLILRDEIVFNILTDTGIDTSWPNRCTIYGGELSFDLNTSLLKQNGYNVKGLGQKWVDDTFEIYNDRITSVKVEWTQNTNYPGGESLGYKEFNSIYESTYDKIQAVKATTFYETMSDKGFINIKNVFVDEEITVILTK